jgi:TRAP-type C4-dicarboxylate transport system permease large subunit
MTLMMLLVFAVLLALAVPVGYALLISSGLAAVAVGGIPSVAAIVKIFQPTQSFPLLAIPFFMLSGSLMMGGTLGKRLIDFATMLVGRFHGGLGQVTVVGSTVFGGVSGSAVAEASALGSMLIPWQKREGYPGAFAAAATASSATIAGLVPGLLLCVGFMLTCYLSGRLRGFKRLASEITFKGVLRVTIAAAPALAMPAFIVVLLRAGIATPTEVSVLAVFYGLMVSMLVYRDLTLRRLYDALVHTAITTGVVMLVIAASNLVGYVLTVESVPTAVAEWTARTLSSPWMVIFMLNLIMVVVGMFLDLPAAILLLGPTFVAIGNAIGLDLTQLGIMMVVNLSIGLFTPPVGTTLFIASAISREKVGAVVRELWPFYLVAIIVLGLVSFVPAFTLY